MEVDYLPEEMNAYANGMKLPEISEFYRGWRAACEAMAKAQPAPDWRAACFVQLNDNGYARVLSVHRTHWYGSHAQHWYPATEQDHGFCYHGIEWGRAALAACPTPPPDAEVKP